MPLSGGLHHQCVWTWQFWADCTFNTLGFDLQWGLRAASAVLGHLTWVKACEPQTPKFLVWLKG
jgi:hypothetical protein